MNSKAMRSCIRIFTIIAMLDFLMPTVVNAAGVTSVTVDPVTASVEKGGTKKFVATVNGDNNPSQDVTWGIEGEHVDGTSISTDGTLTVSSHETATSFIVTATSTVDTSKSGTAAVTVTAPEEEEYVAPDTGVKTA